MDSPLGGNRDREGAARVKIGQSVSGPGDVLRGMAMRRRLMECGCAVEFPVAAIAVMAMIADRSLMSWTCAEQIADRDLARTSFPRRRALLYFGVAEHPEPLASFLQDVIPAKAGIQSLQRYSSRTSFPRTREFSDFERRCKKAEKLNMLL
ncbi:hypothetical protein [Lysobacter capsici]|uniref:hypothetical protein n=1 Tax=Lysobacter capsici TaxID=435897 RepID=UPI001C003462|nr:hypothetical protein [Lysobacter capsici]QWF18824.1 hypothetical protein KME82_08830 [Lysobacter capsici]